MLQQLKRPPKSTELPAAGSQFACNPRHGDPAGAVYRVVGRRGTGYAIDAVPREGLCRLIDAPELPFRIESCTVIKDGGSATLIRTDWPLQSGPRPVAYKRMSRPNWPKLLTDLVRCNRAHRAWRLGRAFLERGVPTARPLAVVLPRGHRWGAPVFLMTEWIPHSRNLHQFAQDLDRLDPPERSDKTDSAAAELGRMLGRMHVRNISHRDLKPFNLLVADGDGGRPVPYVIDLDGAAIWKWLSRRRRLRDLARLAIGMERYPVVRKTVRLRFLQAYLKGFGAAAGNWKPLWRQLDRATAHLRARRRQRMRRP